VPSDALSTLVSLLLMEGRVMKDRGRPSEVIGNMGTSGYLVQRNAKAATLSSRDTKASTTSKIIASLKKR
jgi:hypothetical protein